MDLRRAQFKISALEAKVAKAAAQHAAELESRTQALRDEIEQLKKAAESGTVSGSDVQLRADYDDLVAGMKAESSNWDGERQRLLDRIHILERDHAALQMQADADRSDMGERVQGLEQRITELNDESKMVLIGKDHELRRLRDQAAAAIEGERNALSQLERERTEWVLERSAMQSRIDERAKAMIAAQTRLDAVNNETAALLDARNAEIDDLRKTLSESEATVKALNLAMEQLRHELSDVTGKARRELAELTERFEANDASHRAQLEALKVEAHNRQGDLDLTVSALQQRVDQGNATIASLTQQYETATKRADSLEAHREEYTAQAQIQLRERDDHIRELTTELNAQKDANANLVSNLEDARDSVISDLQKTLSEKDLAWSSLNETVACLRRELAEVTAKAEKDVSALNDQITLNASSHETELAAIQARAEERERGLERAASKLRADAERDQSVVISLTEELSTTTERVEALQTRLEQQQGQTQALQLEFDEHVKQLRFQLSAEKDANACLHSNVDGYVRRVAEANEKAIADHAAANGLILNLSRQVAALTEANAQLSTNVGDAQSSLRHHVSEFDAMFRQFENWHIAIQESLGRAFQANEQLVSLQLVLDEQTRAYADQVSTLRSRYESDLAAQRSECDSLRSDRSSLQDVNADLQRKLESEREVFDERARTMTSEREALQSMVASLQLQIDQQISAATDTQKSLEDENSRLTQACEKVTQHLAASEASAASLHDELTVLRSDVNALEGSESRTQNVLQELTQAGETLKQENHRLTSMIAELRTKANDDVRSLMLALNQKNEEIRGIVMQNQEQSAIAAILRRMSLDFPISPYDNLSCGLHNTDRAFEALLDRVHQGREEFGFILTTLVDTLVRLLLAGDATIDDLRKSLQEALERSEARWAAAVDEKSHLVAVIQDIATELVTSTAHATEKIHVLDAAIKQVTFECAAMEQQYLCQERESLDACSELVAVQHDIRNLQGEVADARNNERSLRAENAELQTVLDSIRQCLSQVAVTEPVQSEQLSEDSSVTTLKQMLSDLSLHREKDLIRRSENADLLEKVGRLETDLAEALQETENERHLLAARTDEKNNLSDEVGKWIRENAALQEQIAALSSRIASGAIGDQPLRQPTDPTEGSPGHALDTVGATQDDLATTPSEKQACLQPGGLGAALDWQRLVSHLVTSLEDVAGLAACLWNAGDTIGALTEEVEYLRRCIFSERQSGGPRWHSHGIEVIEYVSCLNHEAESHSDELRQALMEAEVALDESQAEAERQQLCCQQMEDEILELQVQRDQAIAELRKCTSAADLELARAEAELIATESLTELALAHEMLEIERNDAAEVQRQLKNIVNERDDMVAELCRWQVQLSLNFAQEFSVQPFRAIIPNAIEDSELLRSELASLRYHHSQQEQTWAKEQERFASESEHLRMQISMMACSHDRLQSEVSMWRQSTMAIPKTVDDISGVIAKQYQDIEALQGALELSLRASDDLEIRLCDAQRGACLYRSDHDELFTKWSTALDRQSGQFSSQICMLRGRHEQALLAYRERLLDAERSASELEEQHRSVQERLQTENRTLQRDNELRVRTYSTTLTTLETEHAKCGTLIEAATQEAASLREELAGLKSQPSQNATSAANPDGAAMTEDDKVKLNQLVTQSRKLQKQIKILEAKNRMLEKKLAPSTSAAAPTALVRSPLSEINNREP
ncbi:hypothetical protein PBRA_008064 [Plasmodiophora brassicae]|uniref:Uncharacterized protein n=1 Tax=Plasmodiophora brassicae TaxID=37360 RepID=A0A0G4IYC3_PLABS|nr:hypothetical protein PBRA_008064 [Plasmodiophora brassicae]